MVIVDLSFIAVLMAAGTAECRCGVGGVAFSAGVPLILVIMLRAAVNRETGRGIYVVRRTEQRRRRPCTLRMTYGTVVVEIQRGMICR